MTSPKYNVRVQFLLDILLQYMCSKTGPAENPIEMKTTDSHFSLFYFHLNYLVDRSNATALARDKQDCTNGDFFKLLVLNRELVKRGFIYSNFRFFSRE